MSATKALHRGWVVQLLLVLFAVAVLPVIIGILLDWRLHTAPIITLGTMFLGFNLGILTIYRRIAVIYAQLAPPDQDKPESE
jgi:F0F1-type ATP synthase assembly protein I